jgi:uncharacterized protein (DUF608 family)
MQWREVSQTTSILPVVDDIFSWFSRIDDDIRELHTLLQTQSLDTSGAFAVWENLQKNKEIWYTLLGKNGPTRILLLNQNSDELRAGG